jgi:hypothetical protein
MIPGGVLWKLQVGYDPLYLTNSLSLSPLRYGSLQALYLLSHAPSPEYWDYKHEPPFPANAFPCCSTMVMFYAGY